ncbi:permease [Nocardia terpenica]|uniref:permease n=1 Tax=Nocardia terpenica TaxID=455432 RepID=UPI001893ECA3|nr:permease [Nocardia terpenica]MBF6066248.1 permease [Nocardia terpenica]MBF6109332.1 permease [Nocardia terpenica]MBF6116546.1 permease [Nocardia terpenica]MBF6123633.1 permease [Nocardia terpenica]MBF6156966.1 permease [Nocardia terpenica]
MTSRSVEQSSGTESSFALWRNRILGLVAVVAVLVVAYLLLAAFIPRWWAQRVADMSGHGSFARGIWSGLALGFVCTLIPLLLLYFAARVWRARAGRFLAGAAAVLAIAAALPNLMTLAIVRGRNGAAQTGQQILNVNAPGFRGATLIAVIVAAVLFLLIITASVRRRFRKRRAARQSTPATPPADPPPAPPAETTPPEPKPSDH